jgi:hypothetical protein
MSSGISGTFLLVERKNRIRRTTQAKTIRDRDFFTLRSFLWPRTEGKTIDARRGEDVSHYGVVFICSAPSLMISGPTRPALFLINPGERLVSI